MGFVSFPRQLLTFHTLDWSAEYDLNAAKIFNFYFQSHGNLIEFFLLKSVNTNGLLFKFNFMFFFLVSFRWHELNCCDHMIL